LDVVNINGISDKFVRTFVKQLHRVVINAGVDIGTEESKTDSLVGHLLDRVLEFNGWPFTIR
jgi:hypothetical protein